MPKRTGASIASVFNPPDEAIDLATDWAILVRPFSSAAVPVFVASQPAATSVVTSVASALVNTTLLAANADRLSATFHNDSNSRLFLKLGAVASLASFTVRLNAQGYYELPYRYTGIIEGIWSPVASGSVRITELTP